MKKILFLGTGGYYGYQYYDPSGVESLKKGVRTLYTLAFCYYSYNEMDDRNAAHKVCAEKVLWLCESNRGVYLKAGQYISALDRTFPEPYTSALKKLQDQGPQVSFEEIVETIKEDFPDRPVSEMFSRLDPKAIAAASIAQVHEGEVDGRRVAVKIQFPRLRREYLLDRWVIGHVKDIMKECVPHIDLDKVLVNFVHTMERELDFNSEKENSRKSKALFAGDKSVYIPEVLDSYSSSRVLTMEYVSGVRITDHAGIKELKLDTLECSRMMSRLFSRMIFQHGFIHCDPHPGNILVRAQNGRPQLVLLDHGLYETLSPKQRDQFSLLWRSLIVMDYRQVKRISYELGIDDYFIYLPMAFTFRTMGSKKAIGYRWTEEDRRKLNNEEFITAENISCLMQRLPDNYLMILKTVNLVATHNRLLGNSGRHRMFTFLREALRSLYPNPIVFYLQQFYVSSRLFLFEYCYPLFYLMFSSSYKVTL